MWKLIKETDWLLLGSLIFISIAGVLTISFASESTLFIRQIIWLSVAILALLSSSLIDWRFLRRTETILLIFTFTSFILLLLFIAGSVFKGAQSWFDLGAFAFQPVDFAKVALILVLSKYFSRRHIDIANIRHIVVSGSYSFIIFALVLLQPDFGSAIIIFSIWFAMVMFSGISKKHLLAVFVVGAVSFMMLWSFVFKDYQKARIMTFIHPLTDLTGAGYNAYQSTIAVGSGEIIGKGVGLGSQSKLKFLPEYETDFIFAAFSEEWGFIGASILFLLYGIVFWRIIDIAKKGATNFEILYGLGILAFFLSHFVIHVGMNMGVMPVTGITMPFMSYGGSHILAEYVAVGILMGQSRFSRAAHRENTKNEILGVV